VELRHLRYFVAAAENENVSRAALKLHVSQPALSRQIHDLEDELGFALFQRDAKSLRLTEAGRAFLNESRAVLQRAQSAVAAARAVAEGGRAELHVGYAPSPLARILPRTLRAFQEQRPKVRVRLHDLSTEELVTGVRERKLALALMVRPSRGLLRGLRFEELARDPVRLAVAPTHPLAKLASVTVARALQEPWIVFTRKDYPEYHDQLEALFSSAGSRPRIAEEHDSGASLVAALEAGCGVALVPETLACSTGPRLKLLTLVPAPEPVVIGAVSPKADLSAAAGEFLAVAHAVAKQTQAGTTTNHRKQTGPAARTD
jgi:DNA-binding transcriptional LysR family regulator